MSECFGTLRKMSKKCPTAISRERSPQKKCRQNVPPIWCSQKNVKKMSLATVSARQPEEEKREVASWQSLSPRTGAVLTPKSLAPCHLAGVSLLCRGRGPNSRKSSAQCSAADHFNMHFSYLVCWYIQQKRLCIYIWEVYSSEMIGIRLVSDWYTVSIRRSVCEPHILGVC